jgi:hypothetical protein
MCKQGGLNIFYRLHTVLACDFTILLYWEKKQMNDITFKRGELRQLAMEITASTHLTPGGILQVMHELRAFRRQNPTAFLECFVPSVL